MAMILSTSAPRQPGPDPLRAVSNIQYQTSLTSSTPRLSIISLPGQPSPEGGGPLSVPPANEIKFIFGASFCVKRARPASVGVERIVKLRGP
jgi:hypothetical protein